MKIEITVSKAELSKLGYPSSQLIKTFVWNQVCKSSSETGERIDLNELDLDVGINVVD